MVGAVAESYSNISDYVFVTSLDPLFGTTRDRGHMFCDLVAAHMEQQVSIQQYAAATRALRDIDPRLSTARSGHVSPTSMSLSLTLEGSLLDVFQTAASTNNWNTKLAYGLIERATMSDWLSLKRTNTPLFTDLANCLKTTMLWIMRVENNLVSWNGCTRSSQNKLMTLCSVQQRGVVSVLAFCGCLFLERLRLGKLDLERSNQMKCGKTSWSFAKCKVPTDGWSSSAVCLGLVALGIHNGDIPRLQTCQSITMGSTLCGS